MNEPLISDVRCYDTNINTAFCSQGNGFEHGIVNNQISFYKKVLRIEGQNSFSDHFKELCYPVLVERMKKIFKTAAVSDFQVSFMVDGIISALKRWLTSPECMPPEEFIEQIQSCVRMTAIHIYENLDDYKPSKDD